MTQVPANIFPSLFKHLTDIMVHTNLVKSKGTVSKQINMSFLKVS